MELSRAQLEVFEAIKVLVERRGYSPSVRDLCAHTGRKSTNAIAEILNRLERKGLITREANTPRTIRVMRGGDANRTDDT